MKELLRAGADARTRADFAFTATLSGLAHLRRLKRWKSAGYRVKLICLLLPSPRLALRRTAAHEPAGDSDGGTRIIKAEGTRLRQLRPRQGRQNEEGRQQNSAAGVADSQAFGIAAKRHRSHKTLRLMSFFVEKTFVCFVCFAVSIRVHQRNLRLKSLRHLTAASPRSRRRGKFLRGRLGGTELKSFASDFRQTHDKVMDSCRHTVCCRARPSQERASVCGRISGV